MQFRLFRRLPNLNDSRRIWLLAVLTAIIGGYILATTVLIARDGTAFINFARHLSHHPIETMQRNDQHPLYPAMILGVGKTCSLVGEGESIIGWVHSAQLATLLCRVLCVVPLFLFGRLAVGSRAAFWGLLLFVFLPKPAAWGSDALSDFPHVLFFSTAFCLAAYALERPGWWWFGIAGSVAGIGYLVRPECGMVLVVSLCMLFIVFVRPRAKWTRGHAAGSAAVLVLGFLLTAAPYMALKGALIPKKQLGTFREVASLPRHVPSESAVSLVGKVGVQAIVKKWQDPAVMRKVGSRPPMSFAASVAEVCGEFAHTLGYVAIPFWVIGLVCLTRRGIQCRSAGGMILCLLALTGCTLVWLGWRYGYVSGRHGLPVAAHTIFLVPWGVRSVCVLLARKTPRLRKPAEGSNSRWRLRGNSWKLVGVATAIMAAILLPRTLRPLRNDKIGHLHASVWLKQNSTPADVIIDRHGWSSFYAGRTVNRLCAVPPVENLRQLLDGRKVYAVVVNEAGASFSRADEVRKKVQPLALLECASFGMKGKNDTKSVDIYQVLKGQNAGLRSTME